MTEPLPDKETATRRKRLLARGPQLVRAKLQGKVFIVPSLVTAASLFCGFLAIISAFRENFVYATGCIAFAAVLDGLDGQVARRLNATSEFGREYDSLSDVIAFGVAPAVLAYIWGFQATADDFGVLVAFVFAACGATRLARYNITAVTVGKRHFQGLPIPAAAASVASLVYYHPAPLLGDVSATLSMVALLVLSLLMVSTLPYLGPKHLRLGNVAPAVVVVVISAIIAMSWYNPKVSILIGCQLYVLSGVMGALLQRYAPHTLEQIQHLLGLIDKTD